MSCLICESCKGQYGSCDEFMEYLILNVTQLNNVFLRSKTDNPTTAAKEVHETVANFFVPGFFVVIAADTNSTDTVWFIQIFENHYVEDSVLCDDYSHKIAVGVNFLKGHVLEKEELPTTKVFKTWFKDHILLL